MLLDNVAVSPRAQGRGFGMQLIAFAERCARDAGFSALRLYTQDIMTENLALYRGSDSSKPIAAKNSG